MSRDRTIKERNDLQKLKEERKARIIGGGDGLTIRYINGVPSISKSK